MTLAFIRFADYLGGKVRISDATGNLQGTF